MSDKLQHTTAHMRIKMIDKYGVDPKIHHKHDKLHSPFRSHWKSHPSTLKLKKIDENNVLNESTGRIGKFNALKVKKRLYNDHNH